MEALTGCGAHRIGKSAMAFNPVPRRIRHHGCKNISALHYRAIIADSSGPNNSRAGIVLM